MTSVDAGSGGRVGGGVVALVVAVVELLVESMEREAVRRMESDDLSDAEIERLGARLAEIEAELDALKEREDVDEEVERLRGQLDGVVGDALSRLEDRDRPYASLEGSE